MDGNLRTEPKGEARENIQVFLRMRPRNKREREREEEDIWKVNINSIQLDSQKHGTLLKQKKVYHSSFTNKMVFFSN